MSRPRKPPEPQFRAGQYWVRPTVEIDGVKVRPWYALGTDSKAVANAKARDLFDRLERGEIPKATELRVPETMKEVFARTVAELKRDGMKSWKDREQRLRDYAEPAIGKLDYAAVRALHIREILEACAREGRSKQTVKHLRQDLLCIFDRLWRDELIKENPVLKTSVPKFATEDARPRQILTDEEFAKFLMCEQVSLLLRTMALVSRTFGGLRTSDLHVWRWDHIDTASWSVAQVRRPKTKGMAFLEVPELLRFWLKRWHLENEKPTSGPVFPVGRGARAEEHRKHTGYARQLRAALWEAGVRRAELHDNGELSKRVDFHSFRRAYATAIADSGLNAQTAMRLAGHAKLETHLRYVSQLRTLAAPDGVLSTLTRQMLEAEAANQQDSSGADGTRTRGLRRDRQKESRFLRLFSDAFGPARPGARGLKTEWRASPRRFETKLPAEALRWEG